MPDLGVPDGMRPVEVQNVVFDPNRQREDGQKRKREPTLAFKYAWVMIKGTKVRLGHDIMIKGTTSWWWLTVDCGGAARRISALCRTESRLRSQFSLFERASAARTHRVFIVPFPRKGCAGRSRLFTVTKLRGGRSRALPDSSQGQEQIRLWDFPSRRVLYREILPAVNLVFADSIYDVNTQRVNMCADFAKLKAFACMGACIAVAQSELEYEDPLGGKIDVIHQRTFRMPTTQSANKYWLIGDSISQSANKFSNAHDSISQ